MVAEYNPDALFADGWDACLVGVVERFGMCPVALYDKDLIVDKLMRRDKLSLEEAEEYFVFNIVGAYVGENTPAFMTGLR